MHIVEVAQLPTKGLAQLVNQSREQSKVLAVIFKITSIFMLRSEYSWK